MTNQKSDLTFPPRSTTILPSRPSNWLSLLLPACHWPSWLINHHHPSRFFFIHLHTLKVNLAFEDQGQERTSWLLPSYKTSMNRLYNFNFSDFPLFFTSFSFLFFLNFISHHSSMGLVQLVHYVEHKLNVNRQHSTTDTSTVNNCPSD